jgi:GNAT superfamily N-acetyltransferase
MIRRATSHDIVAIRNLMAVEPGHWQPDWSDATLERALHASGGLAFVWQEGSRILGFVCAHDLGFRAYLSDLIVAPLARGRGLGRTLIEGVERELLARGGRLIIADVWRDALPFYRSLGWHPPDAVLVRKRLDAASQPNHRAIDLVITEARVEDIPALRRLMQLYLYDLATLEGWDVGDDGTLGNAERIEGFWAASDRRSYLFRVGGKLAGFGLVRRGTYFSGTTRPR